MMNILDFLTKGIFARRDGSSDKFAFVVNSVREEYAIIKHRYPGFRLAKQSLRQIDGKDFDVMELSNAAGEKKTLFFDISRFLKR